MITGKLTMDRAVAWAARGLLAVLFAAGAVQKAVDPGPAMGLLAGFGLPPVLVWPAALFNGVAALCLILGWALRPLGFLMAAYCLVTSVFHFVPDDPWQMSILVKNWAIAGGCLALAQAAGCKKI